MSRPTVAAIIPVFNEEAAIGQVLREIPREFVDEVIVVDGGSSDGTAEAARRQGGQVIVERRRGYGRACATGAQQARSDILAFLDGDGADDPAALPALVELVASDRADLALGARNRMEAGALPAHAVLGNKLAARLISARWHQPISDLPSFKVIRRDKLLALGMVEATYGWTIEMIVKAARRGWRLAETPLNYRRRIGGSSKVSGNAGTSLRAAAAILSTLVRHGFGRSPGRPLIRRRAIVLMAKAPIPGEAKTRLAAVVGPEAAARIHEAFLRATLETARGACDDLALMCPNEVHAAGLRQVASEGIRVWVQDRSGLMAGISQAFERGATLADDVIVGEADSPSLPPAYLEATFGLLSQPGTGIVLGPCTDGGYYLVAAAGLDPAMARALFEEPAYDGATICQATAERARQLGLWVEFAPEWYDVDTVEDLRRLQAELAQPDDPRLASLSKLLDMLGLDSLHATR